MFVVLSFAVLYVFFGQVDYGEFLEGVSSFRRSGDKALRFCFDVYDEGGVGCINLEQLKSVLSCVTRFQDGHHGSGSDGDEHEDDTDHDGKQNRMFFSGPQKQISGGSLNHLLRCPFSFCLEVPVHE